MLRREFLSGVVSAPAASIVDRKQSLAHALQGLEAALRREIGISRFEVKFDPSAELPLLIAAYAEVRA